jgi:hypothetical protein
MRSRVMYWTGREWGGYSPEEYMKCGGFRECATGPHGQGIVPLDRNPGEMSICREGWNGKASGGEGFPKSSAKLKLHAWRLSHVIPERVKDGPIVRA